MPSTTTGFAPHDGSADHAELPGDGHEAARVEVLPDGTVRAARSGARAPQLYVSALDGGVLWGTDLADLVQVLRERGVTVTAHPGTVLAYLRGDDVASAPTTFYEGVLRLRAGDEVRIAPNGEVTRTRPEPAPVHTGASLPQAVRDSLGRCVPDGAEVAVAVAVGEDLASAAMLAGVTATGAEPQLAVRVRAGSVRAQDSSAEPVGTSRARAAIETADVPGEAVHPTTDRFKRDLADLVRTQAEPFPGLGVYAHYCALREIARKGAAGGAAEGAAGDGEDPAALLVVLDATGPVGAGLISSSATRPADEGARGLVAGLRERVRTRGRRILQADAVLAHDFVAATPATGHLPAARGSARDTAAQVAAERNAQRFGLELALPLLDPEVTGALAIAVQAGGEGSSSPLAPFGAPELVAPSVAATVPDRLAAIDQGEWLSRLKGTLYQVFRSAEFAGRPWVDQRAVLEAFEAHVAGRTIGGDDLFWRLLNLELWMRECVDEHGVGADAVLGASGSDGAESADEPAPEGEHGEHDEPDPKAPLDPNPGKVLDLELTDGGRRVIARRYPLQTGKFSATSEMDAEVARYVGGFFAALDAELAADGPASADHREATVGRPWNLTISEKIIAIMQGRSYFVWDIAPSRAARTLSRFVSRTPAGIGLGDPVTMQLAIQEAGLPRVVVAAAAGAAGKVLGRRGLFYEVVGGNVRAIDGPTEYSVYPANVSAKLPPKDPDKVAAHLNDVVRAAVPAAWRETFTGTVVMDANDIGRNTLGKAAPGTDEHYEAQFADNPLGQGREQTPMAIVFER